MFVYGRNINFAFILENRMHQRVKGIDIRTTLTNYYLLGGQVRCNFLQIVALVFCGATTVYIQCSRLERNLQLLSLFCINKIAKITIK